MSRAPRQPSSPQASPGSWYGRFVRNLLLAFVPVVVVWALVTPFYNVFLTRATENLVRMTESPRVTRLEVRKTHYFVITRTDFPTAKGFLESVRITDAHFPLLMLGVFFLAVPGVAWKRRLQNLGWGLLISVFFHIVLLLFWVKFVYSTQLGAWSLEHFGPFARNFWGLGKHLLDLPFKFALPFALWAAFYLGDLLEASGRRPPADAT
ncbi:MAG: hypothetical protein HC897_06400 [Thermoanaerobaculia bacterium]|nr:hypothetical protein [Thermoanaerobaculia bacterium]